MPAVYPHAPLLISSASGRFSAMGALIGAGSSSPTFASAVWPSANLAIYVPLVLPFAYPVKRAFWVNGATVTGTADLGIFSAVTGSKLFSTAATAQSGANASQYVTVDWLVAPGAYYLALALSNTSTFFRSTVFSVILLRMAGLLQEASAEPLPSTMTGAAIGQAYFPLFGITRTTSGF